MMNSKSLALYIKSHNYSYKKQMLLVLAAVIAVHISLLLIFNDFSQALKYAVYNCYLSLFVSLFWCRRFLVYDSSPEKSDHSYIMDVFPFHSFSVKDYFKEIRKNLWIPSLVMSLSALAAAVLVCVFKSEIWEKKAFLFAFLAMAEFLIPYLGWYLERKKCEREMIPSDKTILVKTACGIGTVIQAVTVHLFCVIFLLASAVLGSFILWLAAVDFLDGVTINDRIIMCVYYDYLLWPILILPVMGILVFLCIPNYKTTYKKTLFPVITKIGKRNVCFLFAGICFLLLLAESHSYTVITEDGIIRQKLTSRREYDYHQTADFIIYEEQDSIEMKLIMEDGTVLKIPTMTSISSELFSEKFHGEDAEWFNYLAGKLREAGVSGKFYPINSPY